MAGSALHVRVNAVPQNREAFDQFIDAPVEAPLGFESGCRQARVGNDVIPLVRVFANRRFHIGEPGQMLFYDGAKLRFRKVRVVEAGVVRPPLYFRKMIDRMNKDTRHIANVKVISFEMTLKYDDGAVMDGAIDKIIHEQIETHPRRQAEHRREPETDAVLSLQYEFLGFDFSDAVKGDRTQGRLFRAVLVLFTDAVAVVGHRHDDPLALAYESAEHGHRVEVGRLRGNLVLVAHRRADQRRQRND